MMNYACDFSQSETEKYFEYIINSYTHLITSSAHNESCSITFKTAASRNVTDNTYRSMTVQ